MSVQKDHTPKKSIKAVPTYRGSSSETTVSSGNTTSNDSMETKPQQRPRDAFQFYSDNENLRRARNFQSVDYSNEKSADETSVVRKTRISFESNPLNMIYEMMYGDFEDDDDDDDIDMNGQDIDYAVSFDDQ